MDLLQSNSFEHIFLPLLYNKLKHNSDLIIIKCTDFNLIDDTV